MSRYKDIPLPNEERRRSPKSDVGGFQERARTSEVARAAEQAAAAAKQRERELVAESYFNPGPQDVARQSEFLKQKGFTVTISEDGNEIIGLEWPNFISDFAAFNKLMTHFIKTAQQNHQEYSSSRKDTHGREVPSSFQVMVNILLGSAPGERGMPIFIANNNEEIPRSPAHPHNPAQHALDVAAIENQVPGTQFEMIQQRLNVLHDIGKAITASKIITDEAGNQSVVVTRDIYQDHAHVSAYIVRELLQKYLLDTFKMREKDAGEVAELFSLVIKYHHVFELVENKIITIDDLVKLLHSKLAPFEHLRDNTVTESNEADLENRPLTTADFIDYFSEMKMLHQIASLTIADRLSIPSYSVFALSCIALVVEITKQLDLAEEVINRLNGVVATQFEIVSNTLLAFIQETVSTRGEHAMTLFVGQLVSAVGDLLGGNTQNEEIWTKWINGEAQNPVEEFLT